MKRTFFYGAGVLAVLLMVLGGCDNSTGGDTGGVIKCINAPSALVTYLNGGGDFGIGAFETLTTIAAANADDGTYFVAGLNSSLAGEGDGSASKNTITAKMYSAPNVRWKESGTYNVFFITQTSNQGGWFNVTFTNGSATVDWDKRDLTS